MGYLKKIVVVSHNRTGTQSTKDFLVQLGFKCAHWGGNFIDNESAKKYDKETLYSKLITITKSYNSYLDSPFNQMYKELDLEYPDAKFIQVIRPSAEWVLSIRKLYRLSNKDTFDVYFQHMVDRYLYENITKMSDISDEQLSMIHDSFIGDVSKYFANKDNFIQLDLYDKKLGEKIKNFIDPTLPNIQFPKIDHN